MQIIAPPSIAAFYGSDQVKIQEALEQALTDWHGGTAHNKQVLHLDDKGVEAGGEELMFACYSQSLFAERRSIVVYQMDLFPPARLKELLGWIESPTPETALFMLFSKWNSKSDLSKELTTRKLVEKFDAPSPFQIPQWLQENGKFYNFSIPLSVGHQMVEVLGTDIDRIRLELQKLQLYFAPQIAKKSPFALTSAMLEELLVEQNEGMAYKMHEAFFTRDAKAANILRQMLESAAERLVILSGFYNAVAHMLAATLVKKNGGSNEEQAKAMGIPPSSFNYRSRWIGERSIQELERILVRLEEIEAQLKNGQLKDGHDFALALLPILMYRSVSRKKTR